MSQKLDILKDAAGRIVRLSGSFTKLTNSNEAGDHYAPEPVTITVPEDMEAHLSAAMTVDDWGYIDVTPLSGTGSKVRIINLTDEVESPGPRNGHVRWSAQTDEAVALQPGQYRIEVRQDNAPYSKEYAHAIGNNVSFCEVEATIIYAALPAPAKSIALLPASEYGEVKCDDTDCIAYIKSGDLVSREGLHAISVGLEYSEPAEDASFDNSPSSSVGSDRFKPDNIKLDSSGKTRFKVWTLGNTGTPSVVSLNGAASEPISYLPAVFEDLFEVTVYFTIRESGCTASAETVDIPSVHIGNTERTASAEGLNMGFAKAVKIEGCGRLKTPFVDSDTNEEYPYISYDYAQDKWTYRKFPVGNRENAIFKGHCAGSAKDLRNGAKIQLLLSPAITNAFGGNIFTMADVGEGIGYHHIDLYWGEDDPLGGDPRSCRPQGLNCKLPEGTSIRGIL